jgi:hypothetical protein
MNRDIYRIILEGIANQSNRIARRFTNWAMELQGTGTAEQIAFAQYIQTAQGSIQNAFKGIGIGNFTAANVINAVSDKIDAQLDQVRTFIDQEELELFDMKLTAFQNGTRIAQRLNYPGKNQDGNDFLALCDTISLALDLAQPIWQQAEEHHGGGVAGMNSVLRTLLESVMPTELGPYHYDILQQIECFTKFEGLTLDLHQINLNNPSHGLNLETNLGSPLGG